uniref:E3 ubiquitin-protein ligase Arkadia N-terminal domain-containing protein n=2 Tax=Esox lucius TaxID=8010 RepID=A0A3P8ZCK3_ESOLU
MKMSDTEKTEGFAADDTLPECPAQGGSAASVRRVPEKALKTETTSSAPGEKDGDSPLQTEGDPSLLSMPCLMKELRRDSPESLHASTGSDKPTSGHVYESDSSNPCMLSPSSSGHLADSDTLSSGEEGCTPRAAGEARSAEAGADTGLATGGQMSASSGRKSRRSRSESEMSTSTMAAKKNRCQLAPAAAAVVVGGGGGASGEKQTNGRLAKVKGHRSQKHKERIRLLRQKREAAARKKYNLLQDSSTSDSDLTCDSSTSSSEDEDEATGGKTIPTDIPAGFHRASEGSGVGAQIQGLLDGGGSWDRNSIGSVLEEAMTRFAVMQRQTEERFRVWMEKLTRLDSDDSGDSSIQSSDAPRRRHRHRVPRPSPPSSFLPSSESQETMAAYTLARENANVTMRGVAPDPLNNNNNVLPDVVPVAAQNGNLDVSDPRLLNA